MITQIEIDGFKAFKNFKVEFAPFQVIVGANGSGKSNLFDALQLLGRLASHDLLEAFQDLRGKAGEQFTKVSDKTVLRRMRFAVELLIDRLMRSETTNNTDLKYTRLRYEVEITHVISNLGPDQLFISHEALKSIPRKQDTWATKNNVPSALLPTVLSDEEISFIETNSQRSVVVANKEKRSFSADENRTSLEFSTKDLRRAVISLVLGPEYLPIAVVREEMRSWKFLRLNPEELRNPSSVQGPRFLLPSGSNLPTMLAHMQLEDEFVLADISRDMASLIADIYKVKVERNAARDEYDLWIETSDHRTFSSAVLSDGTLRLLALVAIKNDSQFQGLLCLEEPENSMHPLYMKQMARLLRRLATDFSVERSKNEPLKQIIITTHSPIFAGLPEIVDSLLLAFMPLQTGETEAMPSRVTRMVAVLSPQEAKRLKDHPNKTLELYTLDTVRQFLRADVLREADRSLKKARAALIEDEE